ncbi:MULTISPECIES: carbohydrate kinase family protein [unclassified Pedobacter]|uniref:carbohydrate kinase family protein n=1 Tax=unclassified Pedobacter TaxID=2628915 RepID=UPI00141EDF4E|nr:MULTISPECIES: PfkB family carbohydrate kinase [unclassified Pedobacter]NII82136.1 fructokinase [Pedobacter sp. SG908]NMN36154.1 fructokinase [Pedobacter sp. SG918]
MKDALINNTPAKTILVIGELLADLISENNIESLAFASNFIINQGGSPANLSANLKWLGNHTELVSCVGEDGLGDYLINEMEMAGLSPKYLQRIPKHQTSIVLVGKSTGTPDFIAYRHADMHIGRIDDQLIESSALLHTTAFALSKEPAKSHILEAFAKAYRSGKYVSIDWNYSPAIWNDDNGREVFDQICGFKPLLKISMDDMERFLGRNLTVQESINALNGLNALVICLTCGKDGVWYKTKNGPWTHKPALTVPSVVNVTGAGDAFWAGFLSHFIQEKPIEKCIDHALSIARKKIESAGTLYKTEHIAKI